MINKFFSEIHGKFGFGCMRLPMINGEVDMPQFCEMVDDFLICSPPRQLKLRL